MPYVSISTFKFWDGLNSGSIENVYIAFMNFATVSTFQTKNKFEKINIISVLVFIKH